MQGSTVVRGRPPLRTEQGEVFLVEGDERQGIEFKHLHPTLRARIERAASSAPAVPQAPATRPMPPPKVGVKDLDDDVLLLIPGAPVRGMRLVDTAEASAVEFDGEILPELQAETCAVRVRVFGRFVPPSTSQPAATKGKKVEPQDADFQNRVAYFVKRAVLARDGSAWVIVQDDSLDRVSPPLVEVPAITARGRVLGVKLPVVIEGKSVVPWRWTLTIEAIDV